MATVKDIQCIFSSLTLSHTPVHDSQCLETSSVAKDIWKCDNWQRQTSPSFSGRTDNETTEVIELCRLIAKQNAVLDKRKCHIDETERQIEEYERRIHDERCVQEGYDYLQRAYHLTSYQDFVNRHHRIATEDAIVGCYRQATNEMRQRLADVDAQVVDIATVCRDNASSDCNSEQHSGQLNEFDEGAGYNVDRKVQMFVDRGQMEELRLELERAEDIHRQQLLEHRRLSRAVEDAQRQLDDDETRLTALRAACDEPPVWSPPYVSFDTQKLSRPLKTEEFQEDQQCLKCLYNPDCQISISSRRVLTELSVPGVTTDGSRNSRHVDRYTTPKSCEIYNCSETVASDSASEDTARGSLTSDKEMFMDRRRLNTLV